MTKFGFFCENFENVKEFDLFDSTHDRSSLVRSRRPTEKIFADRDWLASIRWLPNVRNYCGRVVVSRCYHEETQRRSAIGFAAERVIAQRGCVNTYYVTTDICTCEDMNKHASCVSQIVIYEIKFHGLWCTGCIRFVKPCQCTLFPSLSLVLSDRRVDRWSYSFNHILT